MIKQDILDDGSKPLELQPTHEPGLEPVIGEIVEEGPNYRNVGWLGAVALMLKTQFGLGILSIPGVFDTLGMVPGVICVCVAAGISTWANYIIGGFKQRHPEVYGIDDAGGLMFGRIGREVFGVGVCINWIFCSGSGMLSTSIALNAISAHGTCTAVFVVVAAIVSFGLASIRTLGKIKWIAWVGVLCVFTAVMIIVIAVGIEDRPSSAPQTGYWASDYKLFASPSFTEAISAIATLVFAYSGTPGFFPIAEEMRDISLYGRSVLVCQASVTAIYIVAGCVIYYYCGSYVSSPALGSAGILIKKVSYGIALPGVLISTVMLLHFPSKHVFFRIMRGSRHLTDNSFIHWATWLSCTVGVTVASYVIASGIPIFSTLISLIGALLGTLVSYQPLGCMWLYDNWKEGRARPTIRWALMSAWSIFIIILGSFLMVAGTYGSVFSIIEASKASEGASPWSCADNSNS